MSGFTSESASSERAIALPTAVMRAVVRFDTASRRASLSVVGGTMSWAIPAKATMPICVPGSWLSMNPLAASWATVSLLGSMSSAHMLSDTSSASTTVVRLAATVTLAKGRDRARMSSTSASTISANGKWRLHRKPLGIACLISERLE